LVSGCVVNAAGLHVVVSYHILSYPIM
jgi:hypothetical protein